MMTKNGKITWTNERRKLSDLIPWDINPATISKDAAKRLEESLDEFGQVETIAISPNNEIYDGHQRQVVWGASSKFGADYVVDVRVSSRELTERERKKLVIFLRKGTVGQFDFDMLANNWELEDLLEWGFDKKELDIDLWAGNAPEDPGAQIDKAEELRVKWGVESGQLWKLGEHRLICGDCTDQAVVERVMQGEKAQLIVTDPPYGVNYDGGSGNDKKREKLLGDNAPMLYLPFLQVAPIETDCAIYLWHSGREAELVYRAVRECGLVVRSQIVWNKIDAHYGAYMAQYKLKHEPCLYVIHGSPEFCGETNEVTVWDIKQPITNEHHPTQKPLGLFERAIGNHPYQSVYDGFLGSGTTLIACERLHRKCRAVEISPAYCAVAIQRWVDMTQGIPELLEQQT